MSIFRQSQKRNSRKLIFRIVHSPGLLRMPLTYRTEAIPKVGQKGPAMRVSPGMEFRFFVVASGCWLSYTWRSISSCCIFSRPSSLTRVPSPGSR
jgi:hypothetical protein